MAEWWIGTSGWSYRHWREAFYPADVPQRRWLEFYAGHFSTVEINATFYRLQQPSTFEKWAAEVPVGFRFSVKASRYLTHVKRLQDTDEGLRRLLDSTQPLGSRMGVLLVQLPAPFPPAFDRLDGFLTSCPDDLRVAVEVRDLRWIDDRLRDLLTHHRAALVWSDYPEAATPDWVTAPFLYIRRHGWTGRYGGRYPIDALSSLVSRVGAFDREVFCYFNNDADAAAPLDAAHLTQLVGT